MRILAPSGLVLPGQRFTVSTNDRLDLGATAAINALGQAAFTLVALVRWAASSIVSARYLASKQASASTGWRWLTSGTGGQMQLSIRGAANSSYISSANVIAGQLPVWLAVSYDNAAGAGSKCAMWSRRDPFGRGPLVSEALGTNTDPTTPGSEAGQAMYLGESTAVAANTAGGFDYFLYAIFARVLSGAELEVLTNTNPRELAHRANGFWLPGRTGGAVVPDLSGHGLHSLGYQGSVDQLADGITLATPSTTQRWGMLAASAPHLYRPIFGGRAA